jgi:hypothetical protein
MDGHHAEMPAVIEFLPRSGFMRLRPTLLRTARSVARSASSMAACSATCRRWITTLSYMKAFDSSRLARNARAVSQKA